MTKRNLSKYTCIHNGDKAVDILNCFIYHKVIQSIRPLRNVIIEHFIKQQNVFNKRAKFNQYKEPQE